MIGQEIITVQSVEEKTRVLQNAIKYKIQIQFKYKKNGKVYGVRIGNPHALFFHPKTDNLNCDIYQVGGVSDTSQNIPDWRMFTIDFVDEVELVENVHFEVAKGYNPYSDLYRKNICKI